MAVAVFSPDIGLGDVAANGERALLNLDAAGVVAGGLLYERQRGRRGDDPGALKQIGEAGITRDRWEVLRR